MISIYVNKEIFICARNKLCVYLDMEKTSIVFKVAANSLFKASFPCGGRCGKGLCMKCCICCCCNSTVPYSQSCCIIECADEILM